MPRSVSDSMETGQLLTRVRAGEQPAFDELLALHRDYLHKIVTLRLDRTIRARVDPSDVVQDAQLQAAQRIDEYLKHPVLPFRLWLRQIAHDRLLMARRRHHDAGQRTITREQPLPEGSSMQLAQQLLGQEPTASQQFAQQETVQQVQQAIAQLGEPDREILLLINFEGLTGNEAAQILDIQAATARQRYGRALVRLRAQLDKTDSQESGK